jgi:phage baseplate assembly protein W
MSNSPNETQFNPIDEDERFVGILLPMSNSNFGYFAPSKTTREAAFTNLKNLILTMKKERPFQPEFGCDIHRAIFEPASSAGDIQTMIDGSIRDAIAEWLPYIIVEDVVVNMEDADIDNNKIRVTLKFSVSLMSDSLDELTFSSAGGTLIAADEVSPAFLD